MSAPESVPEVRCQRCAHWQILTLPERARLGTCGLTVAVIAHSHYEGAVYCGRRERHVGHQTDRNDGCDRFTVRGDR